MDSNIQLTVDIGGVQEHGESRSSILNTPDTPLSPAAPKFTPGGTLPVLSQGSVDPVHALPEEMLAAGWRRFWSKREGREYFYNKVTQESLWEIPAITQTRVSSNEITKKSSNLDVEVTESFDDPLGIQTPSPSTPTAPPFSPPYLGAKRRSSEEMHSPLAKKMAFNLHSPYYNFEIPTNVIIFERKPLLHILPPHPDIEMTRAQMMHKLRSNYQELCRSREGIDAPLDSFNRWMLERKLVDKGEDPMLPSQCLPEISQSMYKEIMFDIPVQLGKTKYSGDARRNLFKYAEAAKTMIEQRGISSESRKIVKWHAEDTFKLLRTQKSASYEDYKKRLAHVKRQCQPHLTEAAKSSVEGICTKVYNMSCEVVKRLKEAHQKLYQDQNIPIVSTATAPTKRKVMCYPVYLASPSLRLPIVERKLEGDITSLLYKNETIKLNSTHFQKLEQLYHLNCRDDQRFDLFLARAWCLLRRYRTMFGELPNEGASMHGALPVPVFECLHRVFGVTFECFASPLNCYFKQFCSAFPDTDSFFGSRGPLLDLYPLSGSFEANPPYCEELAEAMVDHFESLLRESMEPLSFIVFIPDYRSPPQEALVRLECSPFKKKQITIPKNEHDYRNGFQHSCSKKQLSMPSLHGTLVVFLQNEAGFNKWGPTPDRIRELQLAYRPENIAV